MATSAMKTTRMRSFVRKWQSLAKLGKVHTSTCMDDEYGEEEDHEEYNTLGGDMADSTDREHSAAAGASFASGSTKIPDGFAVVFVGKSQRRYTIHARHLQHPLFKALKERSEIIGIDQSLGLTLGCEVVLFEHLLWMLDSDDPAIHTDSINELAELYMPNDGSGSLLKLLQEDEE